jgi:pimeloyl-ACP methyl ester carboxylesterase
MRNRDRITIAGAVGCALALCFPIWAAQTGPATERTIAGTWEGVIDFQGVKLRTVSKFAKTDGGWAGTIDSPDQGAYNLPLDNISFADPQVSFGFSMADGKYTGTLNAAGDEIAGEWTQRGVTVPLALKRTNAAVPKIEAGATSAPADANRPQVPKKPYPYEEVEVSYDNEQAGITLAGTLTVPEGKRPFPAVVLITGSGPEDRDETVFGHKPFLILSDYLTRQGIAVLRFDDRGVGKSTGTYSTATSEDLAGDALAGVRFLKTRKEINPKRIGLIGHSEGGIIAPIAAVQSKDVAFIVLMAGTAVTGEEVLYRQGRLILKAEGATEEDMANQRAMQEKLFAVLKSETDSAALEQQLRQILNDEAARRPGADEIPQEMLKTQVDSQVALMLSPWFRFFLTYDPQPMLEKVAVPVLAIGGELDLQVDPKQNLPEIKKALEAGGNKDICVEELPGLNHLFQTATTGSITEYAKIEETMAPKALELIGDWIARHTSSRRNLQR